MASVLKYSSYLLLVSLAVCVSTNDRNQGLNSIYPKVPVNQVTNPVQHPVHRGQIYNQYGPHPTSLPVSPVGYPTTYQETVAYPTYPVSLVGYPTTYQETVAYPTYPVPVFGNFFGNRGIHKDPRAAIVIKSVIYSVLFSTLLNRVG